MFDFGHPLLFSDQKYGVHVRKMDHVWVIVTMDIIPESLILLARKSWSRNLSFFINILIVHRSKKTCPIIHQYQGWISYLNPGVHRLLQPSLWKKICRCIKNPLYVDQDWQFNYNFGWNKISNIPGIFSIWYILCALLNINFTLMLHLCNLSYYGIHTLLPYEQELYIK